MVIVVLKKTASVFCIRFEALSERNKNSIEEFMEYILYFLEGKFLDINIKINASNSDIKLIV